MSSLQLIQSALEKSEKETLDFLVGEPYHGPDRALVGSLQKAAAESTYRYAPAKGTMALRKEIARLEAKRGLQVSAENIVVGSGSKSLLFGLLSLLGGDGILVPTPTYPAMLQQPELSGLKITVIELGKPFIVDEIQQNILPEDSGCLVVGHPANPTGKAFSSDQRESLLNWSKKTDTWLIADEVYCDLAWGNGYQSFGIDNVSLNKLVIVRSFSKSLGICGWRLGYVIVPEFMAETLSQWQTVALNPPSTVIQRAVELYLKQNNLDASLAREHYRTTSEGVVTILNDVGLEAIVPDGGFYVFADLRKWLRPDETSFELCQMVAEKLGVGFWPGEDFGKPGWARLALGAVEPLMRERMLARLNKRLSQMRDLI